MLNTAVVNRTVLLYYSQYGKESKGTEVDVRDLVLCWAVTSQRQSRLSPYLYKQPVVTVLKDCSCSIRVAGA